jgi:hypothetical protein
VRPRCPSVVGDPDKAGSGVTTCGGIRVACQLDQDLPAAGNVRERLRRFASHVAGRTGVGSRGAQRGARATAAAFSKRPGGGSSGRILQFAGPPQRRAAPNLLELILKLGFADGYGRNDGGCQEQGY